MITCSRGDFNMRKICDARLRGQFNVTDCPVHVFGLKDRPGQSDVIISTMDEIGVDLQEAVDLLLEAGIDVDVKEFEEFPEEESENEYDGIRIALSHAIREDVSVCKRIVKTLLAALGGKLEIDCSLDITRNSTARSAEAKEIK
jgi:hypothetical protein